MRRLIRVLRVAPTAISGEAQTAESTVTVYCEIKNGDGPLRPRMEGYARIWTGRRPVGQVLVERALVFLRTEFWW